MSVMTMLRFDTIEEKIEDLEKSNAHSLQIVQRQLDLLLKENTEMREMLSRLLEKPPIDG